MLNGGYCWFKIYDEQIWTLLLSPSQLVASYGTVQYSGNSRRKRIAQGLPAQYLRRRLGSKGLLHKLLMFVWD